MIYKLLILFFLLIFSSFIKSKAQVNEIRDTVLLDVVDIVDKSLKLNGFKKETFNSAILKKSMAVNFGEFLASNSSVQIKSYGITGLASISIRGGGAAHTQVNWNGISLNSPMTGQADFSQIPVFFIDEAVIIKSGSAMKNNSGAVGGSINLATKPDWSSHNRAEITMHGGSFAQNEAMVAYSYGNSNLNLQTRAFFSSVNNYKQGANSTDLYSKGFTQSAYFKTKKNIFVDLSVWAQNNYRKIDKKTRGQEIQENTDFFISGSLTKYFEASKIEYLCNFANNQLDYTDSVSAIFSDNRSRRAINTIDFAHDFGSKFKLNSGLSYDYILVNSNNYSTAKEQHKTSIYAGLNFCPHPRFLTYAMLKEELQNTEIKPLIPSVGFDFRVLKNKELIFKTNVAKNHKTPGFNDLYWNPGGNPNLKPESGFTSEFGFAYNKKENDNSNVQTEVTFFYSKISDWIQWEPINSTLWAPSNLKLVVSRGIESYLKIEKYFNTNKSFLNLSYNYIHAREYPNDNKNSESKARLIYIPEHSFNADLGYEIKKFTLKLSTQHTGIRYLYEEKLAAYFVWAFYASFEKKYKNTNLSIFFKINNIFDNEYETVKSYFDAGRVFKLGLNIRFSNILSTKGFKKP